VFVPGGHTAPFGHLEEILDAVRQTGHLAPRRAAAICALGGCLAAITIRNPARKPASPGRPCFNCAVDASALVSSTEGR
jgi:hypothetical protein